MRRAGLGAERSSYQGTATIRSRAYLEALILQQQLLFQELALRVNQARV